MYFQTSSGLYLTGPPSMQDTKSIEELESDYWKDRDFPTGLIESCYQFRKIPIKDLSIGQLRTLISQNIGLKFILPKAFALLNTNILVEAELYPGDLLNAVLNVERAAWENNLKLKDDFKTLLKDQKPRFDKENQDNQFRQLLKQIDKFMNQ
jgi:hypothetical protein